MRRRTFDAATFGRAWLAVSVAKSNDYRRPLLAAVCLSEYPDGVVLTATDSYMMAWASLGDADPLVEPTADHAIDDSRGHLGRLCRDMVKKRPQAKELTLWISATSAVVRYGPHRLVLPLVSQGNVPYPDRRPFIEKPIAPAAAVVAFNPLMLGRIVQIAKLVRAAGWYTFEKPLEVALGGQMAPGRFAIAGHGLRVDALLMPVRFAGAEDGSGDLLKVAPKVEEAPPAKAKKGKAA
jgi:hypothetical protein